ncbi:MAG: hypothetical protein WDN72_00375 [Alphaproteobacteria bacterium]
MPDLVEAIEKARASLKEKEGPVLEPGELLVWNTSFLLHGPGQRVENPSARPGEPRFLKAMQRQFTGSSDRHGFISMSSAIPSRERE